MCGNTSQFLVAREALSRLGAVTVPINPLLTCAEVVHVLRDSKAPLMLADSEHLTAAERAIAGSDACKTIVSLARLAAGQHRSWQPPGITARSIGSTLIYTSGTTGLPKGCLRSAEREAARASEIIETYQVDPSDVHLVFCALAHSAPGIFSRACRAVGATTILMDRFRPAEAIAAIEETKATLFFMVPTQLERMLRLPLSERPKQALSSVRAIAVAGAPLHRSVRQRAVDWLGHDRVWQFYGSSETGTISVQSPGDLITYPTSVGRPLSTVELRIVDEQHRPVEPGAVGELFVRSPTVMDHYVSAEPSSDGYVSVGDLGRLDSGYLYLTGRKYDTIISGGVNVYPAEIERSVVEHEAVAAAVCFGVDDDDWGQIVALCAVAAEGCTIDPTALRAWLRGRLAPFKLPKAFVEVTHEELPQGSSGKSLRTVARDLLSSRLIRID